MISDQNPEECVRGFLRRRNRCLLVPKGRPWRSTAVGYQIKTIQSNLLDGVVVGKTEALFQRPQSILNI